MPKHKFKAAAIETNRLVVRQEFLGENFSGRNLMLTKHKPSRQAQEASKSEGWGHIDPIKLDEFFTWLLEESDEKRPGLK